VLLEILTRVDSDGDNDMRTGAKSVLVFVGVMAGSRVFL
jgi:hypothetical protein